MTLIMMIVMLLVMVVEDGGTSHPHNLLRISNVRYGWQRKEGSKAGTL